MRRAKSPERQTRLVALRTFQSEPDALLAKSVLDAAGIDSMLSRDDFGGRRPDLDWTRGIKLLLRSEDASAAEEILDRKARQ